MMQLPRAAVILATGFLAVASARFVTSPGISDTVVHTENAIQPSIAIESIPTYATQSRRFGDEPEEADDLTMHELEHGANITRRDVFADDVTLCK